MMEKTYRTRGSPMEAPNPNTAEKDESRIVRIETEQQHHRERMNQLEGWMKEHMQEEGKRLDAIWNEIYKIRKWMQWLLGAGAGIGILFTLLQTLGLLASSLKEIWGS